MRVAVKISLAESVRGLSFFDLFFSWLLLSGPMDGLLLPDVMDSYLGWVLVDAL